jgi:hypothetical protein
MSNKQFCVSNAMLEVLYFPRMMMMMLCPFWTARIVLDYYLHDIAKKIQELVICQMEVGCMTVKTLHTQAIHASTYKNIKTA